MQKEIEPLLEILRMNKNTVKTFSALLAIKHTSTCFPVARFLVESNT